MDPIKAQVKMEGMEELDRKLKLLAFPEARKVISSSLRAGAKVEHQAAKAAVPTLTGKLLQNIKVRAGKRKKNYVTVHVMIGKQYWTGEAWYGAAVEFGHRLGSRKLGNSRKQIPGEHFLEYTAEETAQAVIAKIAETTKTLIEKLATEKA